MYDADGNWRYPRPEIEIGWHISRSDNRALIGQCGLLPADPFVGNQHGVYLWAGSAAQSELIAADMAREDDADGTPCAYDLWQADLRGLPVFQDELIAGAAVFTPERVEPERLTLLTSVGCDA